MSFADSFRAARWIRFTNLILQAVLFLALFGGLNYVAQKHLWRRDLTQNRARSLSAETRSYLENLERDVNITVTLTNDGENEELAAAFRDVTGLLREYTYLTRNRAQGRINVEYLDVYQSRKRAEELGIESANVIYLASGGNRHALTLGDLYRINGREKRKDAFIGEAALTAAILDVSSPTKKRIYFLTGHGEMRLQDVDGARGLSQLSDELRQRNFELAGLDLSLTRKIPDDAALLVIAGQLGRFQPSEEELLRNYLQTRAGRLILMLDPGLAKGHGLDNLLFDWGVLVYDDVIHDTDRHNISDTGELILTKFQPHPITQNLITSDLYLLIGPARTVSEDIGRTPDDGLDVKKLVATGDTAWGERSYRLGKAEYTPGQDLHGLLGIMVISERLKPKASLPLSVRGGRLAVFGTADLVTNNRLINVGNLNLFLSTVNWTVDRDTQLSIPARPIQRFQLALSQEELVRLRLGLLLVVPGLVALVGFFVFWTRRN
ncbi:MAG: ABC-type uncharacterized transport system [Lacunisphaera sp.]|nr:ABC-type uncharacterized transport system [Lacunisphaera sp.]MDB6166746.1 ABC-type uncharacterized transport system [Lacunisphaera sp.]